MPKDAALFLSGLIRNPRQVSAIAPSSRAVARAMTADLGPQTGRVVEFGPGTGSFTRAMLRRGVPPGHLTLFELDPRFVSHLRQSLPVEVTVLHEPAEAAIDRIAPGVDAVISGLPLLSMPQAARLGIVATAFKLLRPGGSMMQVTYGPACPVPDDILDDLDLVGEASPLVWMNLPPARVWRFHRAAGGRAD